MGAVRGENPRRKRAGWLLPLLLVLAALIALGIILGLVFGGGGAKKHTKAGAARTPAAAPVTTPGTAAAAAPVTTPGTAVGVLAASPSTAPAAGAATGVASSGPAVGSRSVTLVGGAGMAAKAASGKLDPAGSVGAVLFSEDGVGVDASARAVIDSAARQIRTGHDTSVTVIGYTDTLGHAAANQRLSSERTQAVVAALRQRLGSTNVVFHPEAHGQTQPAATNATAAGRSLNRRVIIEATK